MPMTAQQIVDETRGWSRERVAELVDRLTLALHETPSEIQEAWKKETRRRVAEIENGHVEGIPGDEVSARIRRIVGG